MELTVTLDWCRIRDEVSKHLAIIGKRLTDKDGTTLFAKTTLSSEEESIIQHYVNAAAETFTGELAPLVTYYNSGDFLTFKVKNTRWADDDTGITVPFEGNFIGYCIAYTANAVLGMTYPELSKKYGDDMTNHINAAIKLVYIKNEPSFDSRSLSDVNGAMYNDDGETLFNG